MKKIIATILSIVLLISTLPFNQGGSWGNAIIHAASVPPSTSVSLIGKQSRNSNGTRELRGFMETAPFCFVEVTGSIPIMKKYEV